MGMELLIEIGTEEVPARFSLPAFEQMGQLMEGRLRFYRIKHGQIKTMGTPRRLVICVEDVAERQEKQTVKVVGPPLRLSYYESGKPTKAAIGFANSHGVRVEDLKLEERQDKGTYLIVEKEDLGKEIQALLPAIIPEWIRSLSFPKTMRWGSGDIRFVRPIHWILAIFGGKEVSFKLDGIESSNITYGHRFIHPYPIKIKDFDSYQTLLEEACVICDPQKRKQLILKQVQAEAKKVNGKLKEDKTLLNEVTYLVEWPNALCGSFDTRYLNLPEEVLVTTLRDHQRYFSVVDEEGGLLPKFITVSNTPVENPQIVIEGNERVLRARLSDAAFFLKEDTKIPLGDYIESIKGVVFQEQLGSLYDKSLRIKGISLFLVEELKNPALDSWQKEAVMRILDRAALLCKCDLVTEMVGEFPELQGIMGREYAKRSGEPEEVADAIYEHYLPCFSGDELPLSLPGSILSIANKMDNIAGCFLLDLIPTGSEDPHGLRRQAQGIIQVIIKKSLVFPWDGLIKKALIQIPSLTNITVEEIEPKLHTFLKQRLNNYFLTQGYDYDLINAVLATGDIHPLFIQKRLEALKSFRSEEAFEGILIPFKRVINILPKGKEIQKKADKNLFTEEAEINLYNRFSELEGEVNQEIEQAEYLKALQRIAVLKGHIDLFFDNVLVMHNDNTLKNNRLALLYSIGSVFLKIADFSKIVQE